MPRSFVLVEGESDRTALLTLAGRLGHDLSGVEVVSMGGITNLRRHLAELPGGGRVTVLHDAGETSYVDRTLARHHRPVERFVCDADLEDELIRALGVPRVLDVVAAAGDLAAWHILCNQPFHRGRAETAVLRRFFGTTSGRKEKYAALLAAVLDPGTVPAPLAGVLAAVT
ncbi:TOPRIM nucleotidyl transferase/hydrolase domain-containing protein [Nocardioides antri]|uniref:ATP-dependent endonuclease n=1 Tax=Nocardioides antri TaxID=2607659 RepID=A0A5B1M418_9ACTN|nr:TOPRIM nucleotidyl transferase/hydrolase domain-containing protein [Nocardioides antri]KAA1426517.1 ATP-dependent endonuclease [Nocardioides antri]